MLIFSNYPLWCQGGVGRMQIYLVQCRKVQTTWYDLCGKCAVGGFIRPVETMWSGRCASQLHHNVCVARRLLIYTQGDMQAAARALIEFNGEAGGKMMPSIHLFTHRAHERSRGQSRTTFLNHVAHIDCSDLDSGMTKAMVIQIMLELTTCWSRTSVPCARLSR